MKHKEKAIDLMTQRFLDHLGNKRTMQLLLQQQKQGLFTTTRLDLHSYRGLLKVLSFHEFAAVLPETTRVLDVGAYLNLFCNFLSNMKTARGNIFQCTGLELKQEHCELSRQLFPNQDLVCGDARDMAALVTGPFHLIVFCNFFHWENAFPRHDALRIIRAADSLLESGGIIAFRSPDDKKCHSKTFYLPTKEGPAPPSLFMPWGYTYCTDMFYDCWFITRKNKN